MTALLMKNRQIPQFSRRRLLQGLGVSAAAVPFVLGLDSLFAKASAQSLPSKRFLFMFSPYTSLYYSARLRVPGVDVDISDGSALSAPNAMLKPLAANARHLLVLDRLSWISARYVYENAATSVDGISHPGESNGMASLLTGQCMSGGTNDFANPGLANGISVDRALAKQLFARDPFPSLEIGVQTSEDLTDRYAEKVVSYDGPGKPRLPINDPFALFAQLFPSTNDDYRSMADKSVLDTALQDFQRLQPKLSSADRQLLQQHSDAIRRLELQLAAVGTCGSPTQPSDPPTLDITDRTATHRWAMTPANLPAVGELMTNIAVQALACGLTHVVTMLWTNGESNLVYDFVPEIAALPAPVGLHAMTHARDPNLLYIGQWYAARFNTLVEKLNDIPDSSASGSLLDNSLLMWTTSTGDSASHLFDNVPVVLAGSNGGYFRTGRSLRFNDVWTPDEWSGPILGPADGEATTAAMDKARNGDQRTVGTPDLSNNDLCVSILNSFGLETETFGDPRFCHGALPLISA